MAETPNIQMRAMVAPSLQSQRTPPKEKATVNET